VALKQWKQSLVSLVQHNKKSKLKKMSQSCSFNLAVHLRKVCYLKHQTPCILFNGALVRVNISLYVLYTHVA
jgi:hypothetical protein